MDVSDISEIKNLKMELSNLREEVTKGCIEIVQKLTVKCSTADRAALSAGYELAAAALDQAHANATHLQECSQRDALLSERDKMIYALREELRKVSNQHHEEMKLLTGRAHKLEHEVQGLLRELSAAEARAAQAADDAATRERYLQERETARAADNEADIERDRALATAAAAAAGRDRAQAAAALANEERDRAAAAAALAEQERDRAVAAAHRERDEARNTAAAQLAEARAAVAELEAARSAAATASAELQSTKEELEQREKTISEIRYEKAQLQEKIEKLQRDIYKLHKIAGIEFPERDTSRAPSAVEPEELPGSRDSPDLNARRRRRCDSPAPWTPNDQRRFYRNLRPRQPYKK